MSSNGAEDDEFDRGRVVDDLSNDVPASNKRFKPPVSVDVTAVVVMVFVFVVVIVGIVGKSIVVEN